MPVNQKKVLILLGSPRKKGNSAQLAKMIAAGAESKGAEVEKVYLHGQSISPCQACYACHKPKSKGCAIDDDMQEIYPKLKAADAWVFAGPVYWFNVSAQTKLCLDRMFAMGAYRIDPRPKQGAVALSFGDSDPFNSGCVNALRCFQDAFSYIGLKMAGMVYGSADEPGAIAANAELMAQAEALGKKLAK